MQNDNYHRRNHDHRLHQHHATHGLGHNHAHGEAEHLHSHVHGSPENEQAEERKALCAAFVEGFRAASDKPSYLKLAGIPFRRAGKDGLTMHLVDVAITSNWQLGTASPAFASRELSYLPYPGAMVSERETMMFTYVSITERTNVDVQELVERTQS
jgi:hypothetical protein